MSEAKGAIGLITGVDISFLRFDVVFKPEFSSAVSKGGFFPSSFCFVSCSFNASVMSSITALGLPQKTEGGRQKVEGGKVKGGRCSRIEEGWNMEDSQKSWQMVMWMGPYCSICTRAAVYRVHHSYS